MGWGEPAPVQVSAVMWVGLGTVVSLSQPQPSLPSASISCLGLEISLACGPQAFGRHSPGPERLTPLPQPSCLLLKLAPTLLPAAHLEGGEKPPALHPQPCWGDVSQPLALLLLGGGQGNHRV